MINRLWLGDGYVTVGAEIALSDGRATRIRSFAPVGTLPAGTWIIDPRNDLVCQVTGPSTEWPVIIGDDMCAMPSEIMPVVDEPATPVVIDEWEGYRQ